MNNLKETGIVVGFTVLLFLAGLFTGIWTQRQPNPFPPQPLHEFGGPNERHDRPSWPPERVKEIEEFRHKLSALQEAYRGKIELLLTEDQQKKLEGLIEHFMGAPHSDKPHPPEEGDHPRGQRDSYLMGMANFIGMVVYKPQLDLLTKTLALNPTQHDAIDKLLQQRRQDLLVLVDSTPPPSLRPTGGDWKH